jgi:hypothetical protein
MGAGLVGRVIVSQSVLNTYYRIVGGYTANTVGGGLHLLHLFATIPKKKSL